MSHSNSLKVKLHSDAGHAWLEITLGQLWLAKLDLDDISAYSYFRYDDETRNLTLYLEEDLDAGIFLKAWEKAGFKTQGEAECIYHDDDCFIRDLRRTNTGSNKPRYDLLAA